MIAANNSGLEQSTDFESGPQLVANESTIGIEDLHTSEDLPDPIMGRGKRKKRPTWKVLEQMPQPASPLPPPPPPPATSSEPPSVRSVVAKIIRSAANIFSVFREYTILPTHDPEETTSLDDLSNIPPNALLSPSISSPFSLPISSGISSKGAHSTDNPIAPFSNWSIWAVLNWMWTGSQRKSAAELDRLVHDVILDPRFTPADLNGFNTARETEKLDRHLTFQGDGWIESDVSFSVPDGKPHKSPSDSPIPIFTVSGLHRRSIIAVIRTIWSDTSSRFFHFYPFKLFWNRTNDITERLHGELYTSDSWIKANEELQRSPGEPDCKLERVICALMFWSDSTHLANFGNASLWPLYMFFGNESKYTRCRPSYGACHHVAYLPKVRF